MPSPALYVILQDAVRFGPRPCSRFRLSKEIGQGKTMQQNKNMMIFAFASIVIFLSWFFIQNHFWPPKKGPDKADKKPELEAKKEVKEDKEPKKDKEKAEPPIDPRYLPFLAAVRAAFDPASAADPWRLTAIFAESQKWLPRATPPAQVPDIVVLGGLKDSKHHMEVKLTARGAGVQRLVLNKFRAANYLGRPVPDQDLELIGDDPFLPSYLMYLYNDFDDDARPIDTLGRVNWTLDNKSALVFDADKKVYRSPEGTLEQEARFYIDVSPQCASPRSTRLAPGPTTSRWRCRSRTKGPTATRSSCATSSVEPTACRSRGNGS